jgi:hypothetical protein
MTSKHLPEVSNQTASHDSICRAKRRNNKLRRLREIYGSEFGSVYISKGAVGPIVENDELKVPDEVLETVVPHLSRSHITLDALSDIDPMTNWLVQSSEY